MWNNPIDPKLQALNALLDPSFQRFVDFINEKDIVGCSPGSVLKENAQAEFDPHGIEKNPSLLPA